LRDQPQKVTLITRAGWAFAAYAGAVAQAGPVVAGACGTVGGLDFFLNTENTADLYAFR
jgi:hypothetical protein